MPWFTPCLCVGLAGFCDYFLLTMAIPIFPELDTTGIPSGMLFAAKPMCQLIFLPFVSHLLDGMELTLLCQGLVMELGCLVLFAVTFDYQTWFLLRGLSGLASTLILSGGFAYLGCYYDKPKERATAMGLAFAGVYAGVLAGPTVGGALFEGGHQLPFLVLAAVEILVTIMACTLLPEKHNKGFEHESPESCGSLLAHGAVSGPLLAVLAASSYVAALETTSTRYVMHTFGFDLASAGAVWLYVTVPTIAAVLVSAPLGTRIGRSRLMGIAMVFAGVVALCSPAKSFSALVLSMISAGTCFGIVSGCASPLLGEIADKFFNSTGRVYALANSAEQLGFVLGPLIGSSMSQNWDFSMIRVAFGSLLLTCVPLVCCGLQPSPSSAGASHKGSYGAAL